MPCVMIFYIIHYTRTPFLSPTLGKKAWHHKNYVFQIFNMIKHFLSAVPVQQFLKYWKLSILNIISFTYYSISNLLYHITKQNLAHNDKFIYNSRCSKESKRFVLSIINHLSHLRKRYLTQKLLMVNISGLILYS